MDQSGPRLKDAGSFAWTATRKLLKGSALVERWSGSKSRVASYSLFGEDVHLLSYYKRLAHERNLVVDRGCVVDIGAFRPIKYSNSFGFYRRGWHGINIDPTPGFKRTFDRVRPRDTNLEVGIASQEGTATFFVFDLPSEWNTFDSAFAAHATTVTGIRPQEKSVRISRLDTILDEHLKGEALELLLIDAEGYDLEILRSNDFSKYRPRVILIEVMDASAATLETNPVVQYLKQFGYELFSWVNPNLMLVREDSLLSH
jgi:FkbM family methyltransferase